MLAKRRISVGILAVGLVAGALSVPVVYGQNTRGGQQGQQDGGQQGGRQQAGFHLIPRFAEQKMDLTDDQKDQIADLEKDTKEKLSKILTADQMTILNTARPPRPGQGGQGGGQGNQGGVQGGGGSDQTGPGGPPPGN